MTEAGRGEAGLTIVEVLVAATILVAGVAYALSALTGSRELTLKSERVDQAVAVGQREIERLRALPYDDIATTTLPSSTSEQPPTLNLLVIAEGVLGLRVTVPQSAQAFVPANPRGLPQRSCIAPTSVPDSAACPVQGRITSGRTRGLVYRYVTYQNSCLNLTLTTACTTLKATALGQQQTLRQDAKRVTVVVALDALKGSTAAPIQTDTVVSS